MEGPFHIEQVAAVASKHPFYSSSHVYPPTPAEISIIKVRESQSNDVASILSKFPITRKEDIYKTIVRLSGDDDPRNTFRHGVYISTTGGSSGNGPPLAFLTDIRENRAQRAACGDLMRRAGLLTEKDCVLSMHTSGNLYRALDLTIDVVEFAGASILAVGHLIPPEEVLTICKKYHPTVLSGDSSQLLRFATHVEKTGARNDLQIRKLHYTSEPMTRVQKAYLESVFSRNNETIDFTSVLASAETGPWGVGNFGLTGPQLEDSADFIFDSRHMFVEVLPLDFNLTAETCNRPCSIDYEGVGVLVVTSLQRLRNPLVRYLTGDIGSVHPLPEEAKAKILEPGVEFLRILRLYGRDLRSSFKWQGEYFDFRVLQKEMATSSWGILRWQIVLENDVVFPSSYALEVRIMRGERSENTEGVQDSGENKLLSEEELVLELKKVFWVDEANGMLFRIKFVDAEGFVRSATANKIIMFVDRR